MTDTDALLAAIEWLERSRDSKSPSIAKIHAVTLLRELERVKAERDALLDKAGYLAGQSIAREEKLQARLDKALSALREIDKLDAESLDDIDFALDEAANIARAAIAEIEGEAPKRIYPREMAEHFDGTEAQAQAYERLHRAEIEGEESTS